MPTLKIAMLTAGGLAPCLSAAVGGLIARYTDLAPEAEIIGYRSGYKGLLLGDHIPVTPEVRAKAHLLLRHGGSPLGNSRIKLTNVKDCVKRGLVKEGQDPLKVAAEQLARDQISVLHTIGGDDTNTTAADLAAYLEANGYHLTVVGLPKTIDNDVVPIRQTLGAWTAAEQGALFAENIVNEQSANPRMLIVHEIMGRKCGWLTAATAKAYRDRLDRTEFVPEFGLDRAHKEVDAVYLPEMPPRHRPRGGPAEGTARRQGLRHDLSQRGRRPSTRSSPRSRGGARCWAATLRPRQDRYGQRRQVVRRPLRADDRGGEVARAEIRPFRPLGGPNADDLRLIQGMVDYAVECGLTGVSGVIGHDEERDGRLRAIEFPRIRGGKAFDPEAAWFTAMLDAIGQPRPDGGRRHDGRRFF